MSRIDGVGVAFCGGGFRSYAEVAAVEDIERNAIRIGAAAGTSMGSLVAVLVGAGLSSSRIAELLVKMDQRVVDEGILKNIGFKALGFLGGGHGLVESAILERFARDILEEAGIRSMADMVMPVAFPACDITSGDLCVFTNDESPLLEYERRLDLHHRKPRCRPMHRGVRLSIPSSSPPPNTWGGPSWTVAVA